MPEKFQGRRAFDGSSLDSKVRLIGGSALLSRVGDTIVDGVRLGSLTGTLRTPRPFEIRPNKKYIEVFAVAGALAVCNIKIACLRSVSADGRQLESPDLDVEMLDGTVGGIEHVRVDPSASVRVKFQDVESYVYEGLAALGRKPRRLTGIVCGFSSAAELTSSELGRLGDEIIRFLLGDDILRLQRGANAPAFRLGSIASRVVNSIEVDVLQEPRLLRFSRDGAVDIASEVRSAVQKKRGLTYRKLDCLMLVVEITDPRGPFEEALLDLRKSRVELGPFSEIIIVDASGNGSHVRLK